MIRVDESETTLNKWFNNETLKDNAIECWNIFIRVLKEAHQIIILDAFITNKTIDVTKIVRTDDYILYKRNQDISNRTVYIQSSLNRCLSGIIKKIKENKRCFIFHLYLKGNYTYQSMHEIFDFSKTATGKQRYDE